MDPAVVLLHYMGAYYLVLVDWWYPQRCGQKHVVVIKLLYNNSAIKLVVF
jgi:hypothetical protein